MSNWTIRRRIMLGFGAFLVLLGIVECVSLAELRHVEVASTVLQQDSLPGLEIAEDIQTQWLSDYALTLHYLIASQNADAGRLPPEVQASRAKLDKIAVEYEKTIFRAEDRAAYENYKRARSEYERVQEQVISDKAAHALADTQIDTQLTPAFTAVIAALREDILQDQHSADDSSVKIVEAVGGARLGIIVAFAAALLLAAVCGFFLIRSVTGMASLVDQVQKSAIQVNTSITEIGATASEQQATASEIAATTTEIGATSREISATSKELVSTMHEVSTVAEHTASLAGNGQAGLSRMAETMRHVTDAASSINAKLVVLNEKAGNINEVVTTITRVADQTNLLSLNAAIEAEKAGEAGRGFAVVATEIRRLADQTAVATYDIEQTVKEIQSAVAAGVMGMDRFSEEVRRGMHEVQQVGEQLSLIIHQAQALAPRFGAVSEGMQAQAKGAEQISDALSQLTESSQQTVQSLRQSTEAIGGLNQVATSLRTAVSHFRFA